MLNRNLFFRTVIDRTPRDLKSINNRGQTTIKAIKADRPRLIFTRAEKSGLTLIIQIDE